MTVGSNHDGSHPKGSRHHAIQPRDERESLSALFDGELPGDAARFALKRLDHDAGWRETCGRWQLIGDAMRGQATATAPVEFAAGVMRALAGEGQYGFAVAGAPTGAFADIPSRAPAARRRWLGGAAIAASVAMAAILVVRPWSDSAGPAPSGQVATASDPVKTTEPVASEPAVAPRARVVDATPAPATAIATADPASAPPARRSAESRTARRAAQRALNEVSSRDQQQTAVATAPTNTGRPFHPPRDEVVTRPWPRAALADPTADGLTVGFGNTAAPVSFYPFEPRLPAETPSAEQR